MFFFIQLLTSVLEEPKLDPQVVSVNDWGSVLFCQLQPSGIYTLTEGHRGCENGDGMWE